MLRNRVKFSIKIMLFTTFLITIILGWYLSIYFFKGILVKTQRNTGPELIVVNSYDRLNKKYQGSNINVSEIFTLQDLDSQNGPIDKGEYIIYGSVESIQKFGISYFFVFNIKGILKKEIYYLLLTLFGGLVAFQITFRIYQKFW